jgi:hypothetical protein
VTAGSSWISLGEVGKITLADSGTRRRSTCHYVCGTCSGGNFNGQVAKMKLDRNRRRLSPGFRIGHHLRTCGVRSLEIGAHCGSPMSKPECPTAHPASLWSRPPEPSSRSVRSARGIPCAVELQTNGVERRWLCPKISRRTGSEEFDV